jgi:hypothetical protein
MKSPAKKQSKLTLIQRNLIVKFSSRSFSSSINALSNSATFLSGMLFPLCGRGFLLKDTNGFQIYTESTNKLDKAIE